MLPQIYHYDPATFEYLGEGVADIDQLESKPKKPVYLMPAHATTVPPKIVAGKTPVFNESTGKWANQVDNRGTVYSTSTGQPEEYAKLGALPATLTKLKPAPMQKWDATAGAWVDDITQISADRIVQLETDYQTALDAGVTYNGALFQSDEKSITTLAEVLTAVANGWTLPAGFVWIDNANNAVTANVAFLKGLSSAFADHKSALFTRLYTAKSKVRAATTIKAVNAVLL